MSDPTPSEVVGTSTTTHKSNKNRKEVTLPPRRVDLIIIHCTASPNGVAKTIQDVENWHRARGFQRRGPYALTHNPKLQHVGYHFVIHLDGSVHSGRHLNEVGAHAEGKNKNSVGVSLIGTDRFSANQWKALKATVTSLSKRYPSATIHGHREFSSKACPGFDVQTWVLGEMNLLPEHFYESPEDLLLRMERDSQSQMSHADPSVRDPPISSNMK